MNITTITTEDGLIARTLKVENTWSGSFLRVTDKQTGKEISTVLGAAKPKLIEALLGENSAFVTDLPEVHFNHGYANAGTVERRVDCYTAEEVLANAKGLLAIHAFMVKQAEEQEEAQRAEAEAVKAKEAANAKRRDELVAELSGYAAKYEFATELSQKAVDRIIDLEEAAKVS